MDRHHRDDDTTNNTPHNIAFLCRACHMAVDGRLALFVSKASARIGALIEEAAAEKRARHFCKRNHPLSGANLYVTPSEGKRVCRECRKLHKGKYDAKRSERNN